MSKEIEELIAEARQCHQARGWSKDPLVDKLENLANRLVDALEATTRERDTALACIAEATKLHRRRDDLEYRWGGGPVCDGCGDEDGWDSKWPCPTVAALDGAPEPEWEYMSDQGAVTDSPENALDRRRKAGPWLPVEGEEGKS